MNKLDRSFYARNACNVAHDLIGKILVHDSHEGLTAGIIVEAEAYRGPEDKAAHSYAGKRTSRTEIMYHEGGLAYVYLIYGMYHCFNVTASVSGKPEAVLENRTGHGQKRARQSRSPEVDRGEDAGC